MLVAILSVRSSQIYALSLPYSVLYAGVVRPEPHRGQYLDVLTKRAEHILYPLEVLFCFSGGSGLIKVSRIQFTLAGSRNVYTYINIYMLY